MFFDEVLHNTIFRGFSFKLGYDVPVRDYLIFRESKQATLDYRLKLEDLHNKIKSINLSVSAIEVQIKVSYHAPNYHQQYIVKELLFGEYQRHYQGDHATKVLETVVETKDSHIITEIFSQQRHRISLPSTISKSPIYMYDLPQKPKHYAN